MDWEAEVLKLFKTLDPQVILAVLFLSEIVKRTLWKHWTLSKSWFLWVPILLAFPLTWLLWGLTGKWTWQIYFRQSFFCGMASDVLYRTAAEPLLKRYLGGNNSEPEKLEEPAP